MNSKIDWFTAAFALGLAIIPVVRPRGIDLFHVLFGNVLGLRRTDLILTLVMGLLVLGTIVVLFRWLHIWSFDPALARALGVPDRALDFVLTALLSAVIVASMNAVGLLLVVAMLIVPGATALLVCTRLRAMMLVAGGVGVLSAIVGLYASFHLDVASGPAIVLAASLAFVIVLLAAPRTGGVARLVERRRRVGRIVTEDLLAALATDSDSTAPTVEGIAEGFGQDAARVGQVAVNLERAGLVTVDGDRVRLTEAGREHTAGMLRETQGHGSGDLLALGDASVLDEVSVREVVGDDPDLRAHMAAVGLLPGRTVWVVAHFDGHTRVVIDADPVDVPRDVAARVLVG